MNIIDTTLTTHAVFSDDGRKRYLLSKSWDESKPKLAIVMLAPSEASGIALDSTTQLVLNNVTRLGYGSVAIVNLFATLNDFELKQAETEDSENMDAIVTLTGLDETNMVVSLYAGSRGVGQIITKLSRTENSKLADTMALGSTVSPKELCCNSIVRYVRAMQNQTGAAVSVHTIADGQSEAVEFLVDESTKNCGKALKDIKLKPNVLIAGISHGADSQVPNGNSVFVPGDTVIVVTSGRSVLHTINDIFA